MAWQEERICGGCGDPFVVTLKPSTADNPRRGRYCCPACASAAWSAELTRRWVPRRERYRKAREAVIRCYSQGRCRCADCGSADRAALLVIANDGTPNREGVRRYLGLVARDFPPGYRVVCRDCHHAACRERDRQARKAPAAGVATGAG